MESFPLRNMGANEASQETDVGRDYHPPLEDPEDPLQVSENVHEGVVNTEDDAPLLPERPPSSSSRSDHSYIFVPISDEEARRTANLPEPNFRPTALKNWYLAILMLWHLLCMGGVVTLIVLGQIQPAWLRFGSRSSFWIWRYMPGLIGFLTTVSWRGTVQWYKRVIPYVRIANIPISPSQRDSDLSSTDLRHLSLSGVTNGPMTFGEIYFHIQRGDCLSALVNLSIMGILLLTPLKSSLFQLVEEGRGWRIQVSKLFGVIGLAIYLWLFSTTLWIFLHLRTRRTGPKWSSTSLASQLCLLQGSNIFDGFDRIEHSSPRGIESAVKWWPDGGFVLRLGYWKQQETNIITHGVRFLPSNGQLEPDPRRAAALQVRGSPDGELDSSEDDDRIWDFFLYDWYIIFTTAVGVAVLAAASYAWARGLIFHPLSLHPDFSDPLYRAIVFSALPTVAYGLFHPTFRGSDLHMRTMMPIQTMASPLPDEDYHRILGPRDERFKGATAVNSMLLDYLSPDAVSCIARAFNLGHYRIILGVVMSTLCNSVFLLVTQIFDFSETKDGTYRVHVDVNKFYVSFAIMIVYCLSNWTLRPYGSMRTCRPMYGLLHFASLVYRSEILRCPEFWLQDPADTEEHMKAQVTLANRLYRFGIYQGTDGQEHVGIGVENGPPTQLLEDDNIFCLERSVSLARAALASGVYDEKSLASAESFMANQPERGPPVQRVRTNQHRSWRRRAKKIARLGS